MISLGCAKNLVDGEIMLGSLLQKGVEITNDAASADAVIVNTCSFIDAAQEESVDTILESAEVREANNRGQALIVSGCLPQRFRDELPKLLPEVDAFMGIDQVAAVHDIVQQALVRRKEKSTSGTSELASGGAKLARRSQTGPLKPEASPELEKASKALRASAKPRLSILLRQPFQAHSDPLSTSMPGQISSPTLPRRGSGSHRATSPTSKLPRAVTIPAAFALSPECVVPTGAGSFPTL